MDPRRRLILRGRFGDARQATPAPPRPPWALRPDARFLDACTRCGDCVRACPEQVLLAADGAYPQIDFSRTGCTLCGDCRRACTTGALGPGDAQDAFAWRVQIGDMCLARRGVECRVCGDACAAGALRFEPTRGGVARPELKLDACTGCGACIAICPVNAIAQRNPG